MSRIAALLATALLTGCASSGPAKIDTAEIARIDVIPLGNNAAGELCSATRNWRDPAAPGIFDRSYAIRCQSVAASRIVGLLRVVDAGEDASKAIEATLSCAVPGVRAVAGLGRIPARRCLDRTLGLETVVLDTRVGDRKLMGSATVAVVGPLEAGMRTLAGYEAEDTGRDRPQAVAELPVDLPASVAAEPITPAPGAETAFDPLIVLRDGVALNQRGLYADASRVLNDALSRLDAAAPAAVRAELTLEAGLADSNISFADASDAHFVRADALLATFNAPAALTRKRNTYRALDLLNRRRFREALVALDRLVSVTADPSQPLLDPANIRALNQSGAEEGLGASIAVPDAAVLTQLVIDAQANWARSVALMGLGDLPGATRAIARADLAYAPLRSEKIDQTSLSWLGARIERQRGRLAAKAGDFDRAVESFDRAILYLARAGGSGVEPVVAETRLERAGLLAREGASVARVRREYTEATDILIASAAAGGVLPAGIEQYLDLLVAEARTGARPDTYERFFRAVQAVGEPAVARQLSELRDVVGADPAIAGLLRQRADLTREITRLRYELASDETDEKGRVERLRSQAEAQLLGIETRLSANGRFRTVEDRPATIAEVRRALRPGEMFLKIVELDRRAYGLLIAGDATTIYPIAADVAQLDQLGKLVRGSIDGRLSQGSLVRFDVAAAYTLYGLLTGPVADKVARASALVVDPAGPLRTLPASVLVTDRASVDAQRTVTADTAFDYSGVRFLGKNTAIATAISPRSFIAARALPRSAARQPFIGFAEHQPLGARPQLAAIGANVPIGTACSATSSTLQSLSSRLRPISQAELTIASLALGQPNAPRLTGAAFSDSAMAERGDLDQFAVLHFATHGLEEGVWGCEKSPPALVTSFGDAGSDGLLSFDEIARLRLDANLVVLSACDTASGVSLGAARRAGQESGGATLEGLVRAFLTANARAVMATHWKVSAEAETAELFRAFYSAGRYLPIGTALQQAQRGLMDKPEWSHPYHWGAYFVVGDDTKTMLGTRQQQPAAGPIAAR